MILWHVEFLGFKDKRISSRPSGIQKTLKPKSEGEFKNALAVFACVESRDTTKEVGDAVQEIYKMVRLIKSPESVVVVPFAHLSEMIAPPKKAFEILQSLCSELEVLGLKVCSVSFGYHKTFELHFRGYGHPLAVAYRSFPRD
jgi:hypothetical protein